MNWIRLLGLPVALIVGVAGDPSRRSPSSDSGAEPAQGKLNSLRVALICSKSLPGQTESNLERHALWLERAARQGAKFIGFPECSLTGYDLSERTAIALESAPVRSLAELAKKHQVYVSAGLVEKREGKFFNTQILVGPGGLLGAMRKVNLTLKERKFFAPGREFPVFDVDRIKVGIAICADATHFETVKLLGLRGAQMVFAPHATYLKRTPQSWLDWRLARWPLFAQDSCLFLAGCNNAGRFEIPGESEKDLHFASGALIVGPDGKTVQRSEPNTNVETMIVADLSFAGIEEKRRNLFSFAELEADLFYGDLVKESPYVRKKDR